MQAHQGMVGCIIILVLYNASNSDPHPPLNYQLNYYIIMCYYNEYT